MNQMQLKHLRERLQKARRIALDTYPDCVLPVRLQRAQREIRAVERKFYRVQSAFRNRVQCEAGKVESAILFMDARDALRAVERFEKRKFK